MAYKDKDRQREAVREATRRYRQRKGTSSVIPCDTPSVIPCEAKSVIPEQVIDECAMRNIMKNDSTAGKVLGELTKARQTSRKGFRE